MDSYSGSYPLKFNPFRLDMANEGAMPESTNPAVDQDNEEQVQVQQKNEPVKDVRPESQASNMSCSTDESVTASLRGLFPISQPPQLEQPVQTPGESIPETT